MLKHLRFVLLSCVTLYTLSADTIPGGDVSGVWFADSSPYYIAGNITLQANDTLIIEPGVLVNFLDGYSFTVNGLLNAIGTEADSITFTASTVWHGIIIYNALDTCRFEYCVMEEVEHFLFSTIYCYNTNTVISHCRISNNESYAASGGITLYSSSAEISYCSIYGNIGGEGGGILCHGGSTPTIFQCSITDNSVTPASVFGGGIAIDGSSNPVIDSCIIIGNYAIRGGGIAILAGSSCTITDCRINADTVWGGGSGRNGGGLYINSPGGIVVISNTTINECFSFDDGGAIYVQDAASVSILRSIIDGNYSYGEGGVLSFMDCDSLYIDHCDVVNNEGFLIASGIMLDGNTNLVLSNSIFRNQSWDDIWFHNYSSASVTYSDFYDWGTGGPFSGNPPAGLGELVQTNYNGDSCDIFYNIFIDPLFEDFVNGNYYLTDSSPCIDAGDPSFPYDPDGTITDMGVFWYDQTGIAEYSVIKNTDKDDFLGATIFGGPLQLPEDKNCRVYDITGRVMDVYKLQPGIYFVEIDNRIVHKVIKIK